MLSTLEVTIEVNIGQIIKDVQRNWTRLEKCIIFFCVSFENYYQKRISGGRKDTSLYPLLRQLVCKIYYTRSQPPL